MQNLIPLKVIIVNKTTYYFNHRNSDTKTLFTETNADQGSFR